MLLKMTGTQETIQDFERVAQKYLNEGRETGTLSPSTIRRKRAAFRSFASFHDAVVLSKYKLPKQPPRKAHPIPGGIESVHRMINAARLDHQRALVALCGLCGLRVSEAISVTCDNVTLEGGASITVFGKGYKTRTIPMSDAAVASVMPSWAAARHMADDRRIVPINDRAARKAITSLGKRIGLKVASHDLRSTFATALYESSDYDVFLVQELLGHADPLTTKGYTEINNDRKVAAVNFNKG
jgi:integrase/recombinase XerC